MHNEYLKLINDKPSENLSEMNFLSDVFRIIKRLRSQSIVIATEVHRLTATHSNFIASILELTNHR